MADWEYGGIYRQHDMTGPVLLPNESCIQVHDLTMGLPDFMRAADTLFIDPPCSTGNLRSFHTKADQDLPYSFSDFEQALFARVAEIAPRHLFLEVFRSNHDAFLARTQAMFAHTRVFESFYYNRPANRCWIIQASNEPLPDYPLERIDEMKAIEWIARHHEYDCIGDLCMGRGSVGKHAYLNGRRFVGTELNKKRLALLVDFIQTSESKKKASCS